MGLNKGQTNNPKGRPKGSRNKITGSLRAAVEDILRLEFSQLPSLLSELDAKDRLNAILKLLNFVLPRLNSIDEKGISYEDLLKEEEDIFQKIQSQIRRSENEVNKIDIDDKTINKSFKKINHG